MADIEELLGSIYRKIQRQPRSPSRALSTSQGRLDELPIAVRAGVANVLAKPVWGSWITGDEVIDHFTETGSSDVNLESHTADTGQSWTLQTGSAGTLRVDTGDYVKRSVASTSIYTVPRANMDHRVSVVMMVSSASTGLVFRFKDTSNYWVWRVTSAGNTIELVKEVAATPTTVFTSGTRTVANGDGLRVSCWDDVIVCEHNGEIVTIQHDSHLAEDAAANEVGLYVLSSATPRLDDFHAWNLTSAARDFEADPGHTFWGAPPYEAWSYRQGPSNLGAAIVDHFVNNQEGTKKITSHSTLTGQSWINPVGDPLLLSPGGGFVTHPLVGGESVALVNVSSGANSRVAATRLRVGGANGIVLRSNAAGTAYIRLWEDAGEYRLQAVGDTLDQSSIFPAANGDLISLEASGSVLIVRINGGTQLIASSPFNSSETRAGLWNNGSFMAMSDFRVWRV